MRYLQNISTHTLAEALAAQTSASPNTHSVPDIQGLLPVQSCLHSRLPEPLYPGQWHAPTAVASREQTVKFTPSLRAVAPLIP